MPTEAPGLHNFFFSALPSHPNYLPSPSYLLCVWQYVSLWIPASYLLFSSKEYVHRQNAQFLLRVVTEFQFNPFPVDGQKDLPIIYGTILTDYNPPSPYRVNRPFYGTHDLFLPPNKRRCGSRSPIRELTVICHYPGYIAVLHLTCFDK
jgi:hypothetical protein